MHVGFAQHIQFAARFHPLRDHARANLSGESHHRPHQSATIGVLVDALDEVAVEFQVVGGKLDHVAQARVPGTGIVNGQPYTALQPPGEVAPQVAVVLHRLLLGELEDEALGKPVPELQQSRVGHERGADVYEKGTPIGGRTELGGGDQAGQLQPVAQTEVGRGVEPPVGGVVRRQVHPGQGLVADHDHIGRADYGLDDGNYRSRLEKLLDNGPQA